MCVEVCCGLQSESCAKLSKSIKCVLKCSVSIMGSRVCSRKGSEALRDKVQFSL